MQLDDLLSPMELDDPQPIGALQAPTLPVAGTPGGARPLPPAALQTPLPAVRLVAGAPGGTPPAFAHLVTGAPGGVRPLPPDALLPAVRLATGTPGGTPPAFAGFAAGALGGARPLPPAALQSPMPSAVRLAAGTPQLAAARTAAPVQPPRAAPNRAVDAQAYTEQITGHCFVAAMLAHKLGMDLKVLKPSKKLCEDTRLAAGLPSACYLNGRQQMVRGQAPSCGPMPPL